MFNFRKTLFSRRGGILAMTALATVFMVGMTALVTDIGFLYYNQARLQTAVNAGWKAGFDRMMQLKSDGILTPDEQGQVRAHVIEVMKTNGYSDEDLATLEVSFGTENKLVVKSKMNVGLFFAKIMDIQSADVAAARESHALSLTQGIIPLAIPHGATKDLSKNFYTCDLFGPDSGFASGTEYILKLGSGGGRSKNPIIMDDTKRILVPMDAGSQSNDGFLRAYGAAYWCLRTNPSDPGYTPVEWLLGYRGGSFLLPYHEDIIKILQDYIVNYQVLETEEDIQAVYTAVGLNILQLYKRPSVAVYSSQAALDPVELTLRAGKIPYGAYSLPGNWPRNLAYKESSCSKMFDTEVLADALNDYDWLHLHHEDFTGFSGGCDYWLDSCKDFYDAGRLGTIGTVSARNKCYDKMCAYCRGFYKSANGTWDAGYNPRPDNVTTNCYNARRRCAEKASYENKLWRDDATISICRKSDLEYPQCTSYNALRTVAANHGFTSDVGSEPKSQYAVFSDGSRPLPDNEPGWFDKANMVQKMKWTVADKIKAHVGGGGFLFAQCFAPETLDLALWQSAIYNGQDPVSAYANCLAFTGFHYKTFPRHEGKTWYSDINTRSGEGKFNLTLPFDPRCQNHGSGYVCDTGEGHTASFILSQVKPTDVILGFQEGNSAAKYIKGTLGLGDFSFMGGHYLNNTYTKRLILNNLLLGSLVEKDYEWTDGTITIVGRQKSNYGPIDPDNTVGGGANDYRDRFIYGFNAPIEIGDRIITEPGNMVGPTDEAVETRVEGTPTYPPSRTIIVPITDIGPEVPLNNAQNGSAKTVYDLQGTDHPGGIYDPALYGFGASVRIIGFAEFEVIPPEEYTRDGDSYASGDSGDLGPYQPGQVRGKFIRYIVKPGDVPVN